MSEIKSDNATSNKNADTATSPSAKSSPQAGFINVSPFIRHLNHAFSGVTESSRVAVRFNKDTMDAEYEPAKIWLRWTTTALLFGISAGAVWYRRKSLEKVGGLVSLAGASRPILSGVSWTAGIAGGLNSRPALMEQKTD
ncbi:hypothetical protein LPJ74_005605 [Coemansia sp. RSA 1843]|nr:hypothetical protein LPJ74_005605 [Coemansia sp. RSA 1843]